MRQLDEYLQARQAVWDYFGYAQDWHAIPLDDRREFYWRLNLAEGKVYFSREREITETEVGTEEDGYEDTVFKDRFLPQAVYPGEEYTMVVVDTHTDGNRFLAVYDNTRRLS